MTQDVINQHFHGEITITHVLRWRRPAPRGALGQHEMIHAANTCNRITYAGGDARPSTVTMASVFSRVT